LSVSCGCVSVQNQNNSKTLKNIYISDDEFSETFIYKAKLLYRQVLGEILTMSYIDFMFKQNFKKIFRIKVKIGKPRYQHLSSIYIYKIECLSVCPEADQTGTC
jgi:hypothetical protein